MISDTFYSKKNFQNIKNTLDKVLDNISKKIEETK